MKGRIEAKEERRGEGERVFFCQLPCHFELTGVSSSCGSESAMSWDKLCNFFYGSFCRGRKKIVQRKRGVGQTLAKDPWEKRLMQLTKVFRKAKGSAQNSSHLYVDREKLYQDLLDTAPSIPPNFDRPALTRFHITETASSPSSLFFLGGIREEHKERKDERRYANFDHRSGGVHFPR